jgi:GT2 family glycosyltransferase
MHGAPIGYVHLSALPATTLTARARRAAHASLAGALARHAQCEVSAEQGDGWHASAARAACPRYFPAHNGEGVTVAVCTRDRTSELIEYCLPALQKITYEPLQILVVDNAPGKESTRKAVGELAAEDPRLLYICEPKPGLSRARNRALVSAEFGLVAFTDDDTMPEPGWVSALAAGFMLDPEAVCVTGAVVPSALNACQRYFEARYSWGEVFEPRRFDLTVHRHSSRLYPFSAGIFGAGANFAVRREFALKVGGFDPILGAGELGRGGEDLDMFLRLVLAGGRIDYVPSAIVWHRHRADIQALREQLYSYGHGLGAYLAKHMANHDLRAALRGQGLRESKVTLGRMRDASQISHLGIHAKRLALAEARGMVIGAVRYRRAAHLRTGIPMETPGS